MKTPSPIYPLVALGLALMFAMIGALSPPKDGARGPAFKKIPIGSISNERLMPATPSFRVDR